MIWSLFTRAGILRVILHLVGWHDPAYRRNHCRQRCLSPGVGASADEPLFCALQGILLLGKFGNGFVPVLRERVVVQHLNPGSLGSQRLFKMDRWEVVLLAR